MRKTLGTIIIIVAALSYFGYIDTALCVHTTSDSYCTKEQKFSNEGRKA